MSYYLRLATTHDLGIGKLGLRKLGIRLWDIKK